jgi:hypothetical protein
MHKLHCHKTISLFPTNQWWVVIREHYDYKHSLCLTFKCWCCMICKLNFDLVSWLTCLDCNCKLCTNVAKKTKYSTWTNETKCTNCTNYTTTKKLHSFTINGELWLGNFMIVTIPYAYHLKCWCCMNCRLKIWVSFLLNLFKLQVQIVFQHLHTRGSSSQSLKTYYWKMGHGARPILIGSTIMWMISSMITTWMWKTSLRTKMTLLSIVSSLIQILNMILFS